MLVMFQTLLYMIYRISCVIFQWR